MPLEGKRVKSLAKMLGIASTTWEETPNGLLLLSFLIRPRMKEYFTKNSNQWRAILGKSPENMIRLFLDKSMIERASVAERMNEIYKINDLKSMLKEKGMPQSGNKAELINRLLDCDHGGMEKLTDRLELYKCSSIGLEYAEKYIQHRDQRRIEVGRNVLSLLEAKEYREAIITAGNFQEPEMLLQEGFPSIAINMDIDTRAAELADILDSTPAILDKASTEALCILKMATAMNSFGPLRIAFLLPEDFETGIEFDSKTCISMIQFSAANKRSMRQYKAQGIKRVIYYACGDSCETCKKLNHKKFVLAEAPELPNPKCSSKNGCRCTYSAVLD